MSATQGKTVSADILAQGLDQFGLVHGRTARDMALGRQVAQFLHGHVVEGLGG
jgi:hypothetical protein